jgi:hypothetical protein
VDPDLATWIRLGGGPTAEEAEQMSEGEKIMQFGNAWVRTQLQLQENAVRQVRSPFRRA